MALAKLQAQAQSRPLAAQLALQDPVQRPRVQPNQDQLDQALINQALILRIPAYLAQFQRDQLCLNQAPAGSLQA